MARTPIEIFRAFNIKMPNGQRITYVSELSERAVTAGLTEEQFLDLL